MVVMHSSSLFAQLLVNSRTCWSPVRLLRLLLLLRTSCFSDSCRHHHHFLFLRHHLHLLFSLFVFSPFDSPVLNSFLQSISPFCQAQPVIVTIIFILYRSSVRSTPFHWPRMCTHSQESRGRRVCCVMLQQTPAALPISLLPVVPSLPISL